MIKSHLYRLLQRTPFRRSRELLVFETDVGVKYRHYRHDPDWATDHIRDDVSCEASGLDAADFVMAPDLLRDPYSSSGVALTASPHYRLMVDIESGALSADSEYVSRQQAGTLDARRPSRCRPGDLARRYDEEKRRLGGRERLVVYAVEVGLKEGSRYCIIDGKHRAAMAAYHHRMDVLQLRLLSNTFARNPFFERIYPFVLGLSPDEYSMNHEVIGAILNEP